MKIKKLVKQFGKYGNEYSVLEIGDKVNEIIDLINGEKHEVEPALEVKEEVLKEKPKNYTQIDIKPEEMVVRAPSSGDMVYLIKEDKKHWVKNPETLKKLGFDFQKIKGISNKELAGYETGKAIDLKERPLEVQKTQDEFDKYNL